MHPEKLGTRIRTYRENQELSRAELAQRAELDELFIAALEEDNIAPSLGPLIRVARALGVRLGTFMDDDACHDLCITRKAERQNLASIHTTTVSPTRNVKGKGLVFHSLGAAKTDRHMEPFFIEINPMDEPYAEGAEPLSSHEGEEFIAVLSGKVLFVHGKDRYLLEEGDSIYYNSIVPHYVGSGGSETATIHAVLYLPC
ncbi:XRE family transcriptional regulator [Oceanidesulfovibrio marinus]|uniref:DNA-binding protein n=1 Tax=Oceanidesulfovibrio marinus TaxID=370038 RepID=A0A6P1ZA31_9BACT|nr:XRE family transcriptional regulator [Oceanidesulfovibrio marinus]QJT10459.1 helix-turn-helix transcriptional regulator [Oceanidesulfovibrio marinus]TVM30337.1 DNA-binding protein [Oceanidesulfovibrio marinus]